MLAALPELPPRPRLAARAPRAGRAPRVTVVMPTYRRPQFVGASVRSVLAQRFEDFELLVRDDGTPADGVEAAIAAAGEGDPRVRYVRNPTRLAMPANLNAGIADAAGEYIATCHDHDLVRAGWLEALVDLLDRHPTALYAHAGITLIDQAGLPTGEEHAEPRPELVEGRAWLHTMLERFYVPVCSIAVTRRSAYEAHGLPHPVYGLHAEAEMWMRLASFGDVAYARGPFVEVRTRERDHPENLDPWLFVFSLLDMHRRHVQTAYTGLERVRHEAGILARGHALVFREARRQWRRAGRLELGGVPPLLRGALGPLGKVLFR